MILMPSPAGKVFLNGVLALRKPIHGGVAVCVESMGPSLPQRLQRAEWVVHWDTISKQVKQIEDRINRINRIKHALDRLGPMRPGSISRQFRNPQERKTPFYQISYTHQMKSRTAGSFASPYAGCGILTLIGGASRCTRSATKDTSRAFIRMVNGWESWKKRLISGRRSFRNSSHWNKPNQKLGQRTIGATE